MHINIVGCNKDAPYVLNIMAVSDGPKVEVVGGIKELDFGECEVLMD